MIQSSRTVLRGPAGATLLLLVGLFALPVQADVKETEEMTFDVSPGARVAVENINGSITVHSGSDGQVRIVAHKKASKQEYLDELRIEVEADDDYVRVETRHPKSEGSWFNWGGDSNGSVSYEITVPGDSNLDAVSSVNGDITIEDVAGPVKAETVNGSIEAGGMMNDGSFETVNGSIHAAFDSMGDGQRINAEAVNGKITLKLPADANARVTADTVNGSIKVADEWDLEVEKGFVGRSLSGDIGSGDGRISVDTVNGSIRIQSQ